MFLELMCLVNSFHLVINSAIPEDWVGSSPFSHFTTEEHNYNDIFTSAFLNVTYYNENGFHSDKTEVGRYGGGPMGSMFGRIIHVSSKQDKEDHSGCTLPLRSSKYRGDLPLSGEPWIALVKRGRCSFETKVENAFKSEASGILIYNDRDTATLDKMALSTDTNRNISAVFIYKWKGEELARLVRLYPEVYVHVSVAGRTVNRSASINRTSVLFVSITFIVLIIISLAWLIFYYVQRFRYSHARERLSKRLNSAAKKAVCKIPTRTLKTGDKELQGDVECCAICIEPYKVSDIIRLLPCSHDFHKLCIDPWLLEHRTCPMCKMDILKYYGFVCSDSQESILQLEREPSGPNSANNGHSSNARDISVNQESSQESSDEESRAPSPNEMTPSITRENQSPKLNDKMFAINLDTEASNDQQSSSTTFY